MSRDPTLRLQDILDAIAEIETILGKKTFEAYRRSLVTRRAVVRCMLIISEASSKLPQSLKGTQAHIPWPQIKGIGNMLRHEYAAIQDAVLWKTANKHLPTLKAAVDAIQKRLAHKKP
jgi:uncharacterized protein with HEPN domain